MLCTDAVQAWMWDSAHALLAGLQEPYSWTSPTLLLSIVLIRTRNKSACWAPPIAGRQYREIFEGYGSRTAQLGDELEIQYTVYQLTK